MYITGVIWFLRYSQNTQISKGRAWGWWGSMGKNGCLGRGRTHTGRIGRIGQWERIQQGALPEMYFLTAHLSLDLRHMDSIFYYSAKAWPHRVPLTKAKGIFCSWFFTEGSTSFQNSFFFIFRVSTTPALFSYLESSLEVNPPQGSRG